MKTSKPTTYTCAGIARGKCGINHRTIAAAVACIRQDERDCAKQRGYSDRAVVRTDGQPLTGEELADERAAS